MGIHDLPPHTVELTSEVTGLLDNAMDFLQKAQEEFSTSPTHSIVSFWTAVELLLKVPLAHEHWSLVCSGKSIVRKKYLSGDFQSITFGEACDRLRDVLEKPLPKATADAFDKIRKHRNRVVHFYHDAYTEDAKAKLLAEQADAWFALNRLLREDWKSIFEGGLAVYLALQETDLLIKNEHYARIKLEQVEHLIVEHINTGGTVLNCHICNQDASLVKIIKKVRDAVLSDTHCLVCSSSSERFIEFKCPACKQIEIISNWAPQDFICSRCHYTSNLYALFDSSQNHPDDHCFEQIPAGCGKCGLEKSICKFGDGFLCTSCLTFYDTLEQCSWCGHYSNIVPENSSLFGCGFCNGPNLRELTKGANLDL